MTTTLDRLENAAPAPLRPERASVSAITRTAAVGWVGILALATGAVWLGVVGTQALSAEGNLSSAIAAARGRIVGPGLIASVIAIVIAERIWPAVRRPFFARGHLIDAAYFGLFALVVPALVVVQTGFGVEIYDHARFLELGRLPIAPRWLIIAAILILTDGMNWLLHVANHRFATLWRLHALHHSQEEMSVLTTFRTHPLIHATYLPVLFPVLLLGASGTVPNIGLIIYGVLVTLPHANLRWTFGRAGTVFVSPAFHRMHHAATPPLGALGCNFGFVLATWDRMFGLAVDPPVGDPVPTGLADRAVPIEQVARRFRPVRTLGAQLLQPFRPNEGRIPTP